MRIVIIAIKSNVISQSPPQRCMLDFINILSSFPNVQNIEILNIALDTSIHNAHLRIANALNSISKRKNHQKEISDKGF